MIYDTFRLIFIGSAIAAGVMLVVSVLLFIFLKIPAVVGYLTGRTARRAIESMGVGDSSGTTTSGAIRRRAVAGRQQRAKTTEEVGRYDASPGMPVKDTSDLMAGSREQEHEGNSVTHFDIADTTDFRANSSDVVADTTDLRECCQAQVEDTTDLSGYQTEIGGGFRIEYEVTFIHTSEIIL